VRTLFLLVVLAISAPALAQTKAKSKASAAAAASAPADDDQPALDTTAKSKAPAESGGLGTTVITGEGESPLGLYLTPWRDSKPEKDIDRPARLLQEDMRPIDKDVFERQVEYYDALSGAAKRKTAKP
jgi:hypothetical protein